MQGLDMTSSTPCRPASASASGTFGWMSRSNMHASESSSSNRQPHVVVVVKVVVEVVVPPQADLTPPTPPAALTHTPTSTSPGHRPHPHPDGGSGLSVTGHCSPRATDPDASAHGVRYGTRVSSETSVRARSNATTPRSSTMIRSEMRSTKPRFCSTINKATREPEADLHPMPVRTRGARGTGSARGLQRAT